MPRPPKDPSNPLTRLREALSTPNYTVTRKAFCERYGFPFDSVTALERGTYKLTREMAQRVASAVGVTSGSLLLNQQPLRAWDGSPVSPSTQPPAMPVSESDLQDMRFFLAAAIKASGRSVVRGKEKDRSTEFFIMFKEWLMSAMHDLGAEKRFWNSLCFSWLEFQPDERTILQFNPNVLHLSRTGSQLPVGSESLKTYFALWNKRRALFEQAKIDVQCEALPKARAAKLRPFLEKVSRLKPNHPKLSATKLEESVALAKLAHTNLARKHNVDYGPGSKPIRDLIDRLAREKLAADTSLNLSGSVPAV